MNNTNMKSSQIKISIDTVQKMSINLYIFWQNLVSVATNCEISLLATSTTFNNFTLSCCYNTWCKKFTNCLIDQPQFIGVAKKEL